MKHFSLYKILEFSRKFLNPPVSLGVLISGGFLTYNFTELGNKHPDWSGAILIVNNSIWWIFLCTAGTAFVFNIVEACCAKKISNIQEELDAVKEKNDVIGDNIKNLFDGVLLNLSRKLDFAQSDNSRISLYIHDEACSSFVPCGRYSTNPELRKPGRTSYPDDQGCIARGWQLGWYFDSSFPNHPYSHCKYCLTNYKIPEEIHKNIKMLSRLIAVKRIDDLGSNPLAVIVVESEDPARFDDVGLREKLNGTIEDYAHMISVLRSYIPSPNNAAERGF